MKKGQKRFVGNEDAELKVLEIMKQADQPVSIDYVGHNLGVEWCTARGLLLSMALQGKIEALKTTKGWIFILQKVEA